MMPKIYKTPRSIPFMGIDGKRSYKVVNDDKNPNGIYMDFNPNDFNISITVGVNAEVSKRISVNQMITMAKMGGWFDEFIVTKCLPEFVSNLDVRHQKAFMKKAEEFMAEKQQEKEAKKQEMMKNPPIDPVRAQISMKQAELNQKHQVDEEKLQQSRLQMQIDTEFKAAEMQQKDGEMQLDAIKALASAKSDQAAAFASIQKADSENLRSNVDLAIQLSKHHEDVKKDKLDRIERVLTHHDKHNHEKKKHEDKMTLEEKTFNATRNREKTNSKE
jgi:myosin heavy subunit